MKKIILLISLSIATISLHAQPETTRGIIRSAFLGVEYGIKAGINLGGTSPLPLPAEIRSIDGYNPLLNITLEANVIKWLDDKWGLESGLRIDNQGMKTKAQVKNYGMRITADNGGYTSGFWTGKVETKVHHTLLTLPVMATYKLSPLWRLQGGLYAAYAFNTDFSGIVYDGYLREDNPTGDKTEIPEAPYDFSNDLVKWQWGAQLGAEWRAFKHLTVHSNLKWGFTDIFKKDFQTITFSMYPIYLNMGFGYAF